jgi:hypothetical protein
MNGEPARSRQLRAEDELLLLCARSCIDETARSRIRALLAHPLDWVRVLAQAAHHGTIPLLHYHLSENIGSTEGLVPRALLDKTQRAAVAGTARHMLLMSALKPALEDLQAAGAPAVVWKGPVLAYSVYPRPTLRPFSDLDLLVRRRDARRARAILLARGYSPRPGLGLPDEEQFARSDNTVPLVDERTRTSIDLHWGGGVRYISSAMDTDALCEQAEPLAVGGTTVPALAPEALLLALCAHGAKHGPFPWPKLKWITDVEAFLRTYPDRDWEAFLRRARTTGCLRMSLLGLCLARDVLEAPIPSAVDAAIRTDPIVNRLALDIRDRLLSGNPPAWNPDAFTFRDRVRFDLAVRERLRDRIRYRSRRLLTTSPRDAAAHQLPAWLRFLQSPFRLARLAAKYIRRPSLFRMLISDRTVRPPGRPDSSEEQT